MTHPGKNQVHRAKVTSKGQITLPKAVRDLLKLEAGSVVEFTQDGGTVTIQPQKRPRRSFREAIGTLAPPDGMTAEEYIADMRYDPGDRELLQQGPGPKEVLTLDEFLRRERGEQ